MKKLHRLPAPDWLRANYKKWGKQYEAKRNDPNKGNEFAWAQYQNEKVNHLLLSPLGTQTQNHCSYCDGYPMNRMGNTIDHFRSKTQFPLLAYVWHNLFLCCYVCQKRKGDFFDKRLLKPDMDGYSFDYYFRFIYIDGSIIPNSRRS